MCTRTVRYRRVKHCRLPLPKQLKSERLGNRFKNYKIRKTSFSGVDVLLLMSILRLYVGLKLSFEQNSAP